MDDDIKKVTALPTLPDTGVGFEPHTLMGILDSFHLSTQVSLTETDDVETISTIEFRGKLDFPNEWEGLPVEGWVMCKVFTKEDIRLSDGQVALGTLRFVPAQAGEEATLQLLQMGTPAFFEDTKGWLEPATPGTRFTIELLDNAQRLDRNERVRVGEFKFRSNMRPVQRS